MRIGTYNYEKYSILDIQKYLEEKGLQTKIKADQWSASLCIKNSQVSVDIPDTKEIVDGSIVPQIRFDNYPRSSIAKEDEKLYKSLKRKFGKKKSENIRVCKDWKEIQRLVKEAKKKFKNCFIYTTTDNPIVPNMYAKLGFKPITLEGLGKGFAKDYCIDSHYTYKKCRERFSKGIIKIFMKE